MILWSIIPTGILLAIKFLFWTMTLMSSLEERKKWQRSPSGKKSNDLLIQYLSRFQRWTWRHFGYVSEYHGFRRYRFLPHNTIEYWLWFIPITGWCIQVERWTWDKYLQRMMWGGPGLPYPDKVLSKLLYLRAHKTFWGNRRVAMAQPAVPV